MVGKQQKADRSRGIKIVGGIFLLAIAMAGIFLIGYVKEIKDYKEAVAGFTYAQIDLKAIPDGSYTGECDVGILYAKVAVKVRDGRMEGIELLEHRNERGAAASGMVGRILGEQRVDVEEVSGATNSSRVIKKAVEDALLRAKAD